MPQPLMPKATAVWLVENTTLTFCQIADFCELHELEIQAIADGDVSSNIRGLSPIDNNQLTLEEIKRCEKDEDAKLTANEIERNVKIKNVKTKKVLSPSQRTDKPAGILWLIKNYSDLMDSQICKLIGTTKNTIENIRTGKHREASSLRPKNPVGIGLCSEKDIEKALSLSVKSLHKEPKAKKEPKVKAPKKAPKKAPAKKATPKKVVVKKAVAKKAVVKKAVAKKVAPKKVVAKKAPAKKVAPKKAVVKKAPAKKVAPKKAVVKKAAPKKVAKKK